MGVLLLLLGSAVAFLTLAPAHSEMFSDVVSVLFAATAATACGLRARRAAARARLAWGLLAAACVSWTLAEAAWLWSHRPDGPLVPLLDDVFYVLGMPLGILALAVLPGSHWHGSDRLRSILDGLIIGSAMLFVFRGLGLLVRSDGPFIDRVVNLSYPVGHLIMLTMALTLVMRAARSTATHVVLLLVAAEASYVIGDSVYAVQVAQDRYRSGTLLDLTWLLSYLLLALAAAAPIYDRGVGQRAPTRYQQQVTPWPLLGLALLAAAAVAAFGPVEITGDWVMVWAGFVIVLLFAARQGWLAHDIGRLNRALFHEMQHTQQISDAVLDGVIAVDPSGVIRSANEAAGQLLGRTAPSLTGLSLFDLLDPAPDGEPSSAGDVVSAIRDGTPITGAETAFRMDGGSTLPVEVTVGPLRQGDRAAGVVVVFRDVSARQAVDRLKQEFLSVVSHELRTPLASIRGALGLLNGGLGGGLGPQGARMVDIALVSSERLSRLLNDILDIERLARGRLHLQLSDHHAADLVAMAVNEMGAFAAQQQVHLQVGGTPGIVAADRDRIVQVLTNLVHNAIKFSAGDGDVVVSTRVDETQVEFCVADQGRGIPPDKLESIFEPFEQIDSSDSRPINGSGLGLAICRDLVRLHGGDIWATSTLGVGSQFLFTLPVAVPTPVEQPAAPVPIAVAG